MYNVRSYGAIKSIIVFSNRTIFFFSNVIPTVLEGNAIFLDFTYLFVAITNVPVEFSCYTRTINLKCPREKQLWKSFREGKREM